MSVIVRFAFGSRYCIHNKTGVSWVLITNDTQKSMQELWAVTQEWCCKWLVLVNYKSTHHHKYDTARLYNMPSHFPIIKPTKCTNFSNLFLEWNSTCFGQFLCPSSGIFHRTHSNGICYTGLLTACEQDVPSWSCSQAVSKLVWHMPLLCVQWKTPDDGQRNCPKRVEFHSKNKWGISESRWFYYKKFNMMYGHMNVKYAITSVYQWTNTMAVWIYQGTRGI